MKKLFPFFIIIIFAVSFSFSEGPDKPVTAEEVIEILGLVPLETDCGGHFRETFRSEFNAGKEDERNAVSVIYHMLKGHEKAGWHSIDSTEIFIYICGVSQRMVLLHPDGNLEERILGPDIRNGEVPKIIVPPNTWMAEIPTDRSEDAFSLIALVVAPGFDPKHYKSGDGAEIIKAYPELKKRIVELGLEK